MPKLNVLIAGSTGYIGIQLIKLLVKHNKVNIKYLCGNYSAGKKITTFEKFKGSKKLPKILKFKKSFLKEVDLVFTALPNGEAQDISNYLLDKNILIDLSADFRLNKASEYLKWYKQKHKSIKNIKRSIYALPEITGKKLKKFNIIGCPGCYPTSILLPLIPIIKKNLIKTGDVIIDSKSGYSGAGRGVHKKYKYKNLNESLSAYGVGFHRHNSEIQQEIDKYTKSKFNFTFTPHLSPMFKGILSTIYVSLKKGVNIKRLEKTLNNQYSKNRFVKILKINSLISTNDVINTNNCTISICKTKYKNRVIILSAIDNLIKGGAGQAVQNMNLRYDFRESKGLK
jgi:N-acetyl-gamma-glutamyl-phosphate reductase